MKRVLIVKLGGIGDIIMALPMIDYLRKKYGKNVEITWIADTASKDLLYTYGVDHVLLADEKKLLYGSFLQKINELLKIWKKLFLKFFDLIAIPYYNPRCKIIPIVCRGNDRRYFSRKFGNMLPIPGRKQSDEYVRLVLNDCDELPNLPSAVIDTSNIQDIICIPQKQPIVILSPGGSKLTGSDLRRWPIEYYVELAKILSFNGYTVFIVGDKNDKWVLEHFKGINIKSYVGKTTIMELVKLLSEACIVVAHDSGIFHMAYASGTKVIGLFGPTMPHGFQPRKKEVEIIWKGNDLACCPCYDSHSYAICESNICMRNISPQEVYERINRCKKNHEDM